MIQVLPKIFLLKIFRSFGFPKVFPLNYTLLISTKCNARCQTCNIWKQKHDELKIDEWKKILISLGSSPFYLTISGGEPFLQPHLVNLCRLIFKINKPAILTIPTNSILWKTISEKTEEILKSARKTKVIINLSLDGVDKKHDKIRGVKGNFTAFEKTYQALRNAQEKYSNLTIGIHSVISKFNVQDADELFNYVFSLNPDQYITEIAEERVELDTVGLSITPNLEEYSRVIDSLIKRIKEKRFKGLSVITEAFRLEYYEFVKEWLKGEKIKIKDYAGWASCQITSWGEVWPSCIHGINLGNLRETNYDFGKIWFGKRGQRFRKEYRFKPESFPLASAFYTNALLDWSTLTKIGKERFK